ncbi:MAG: NfeD family protein [Aquiluna sp.]|nr:NfeD family protein [Aquiluna sp.]
MTFVWLAVIGALVVIELVTYGLYFAALAAAALVPLVLSLFGLDIWVQALGFLAAAVVALVFIRPLITKLQGDKPETMTNVNALVGKPALVTEEVTQVNGYVKIQGEIWSARTSNGSKTVGSEVVIEKIAGATLIVS